MPRRKDVVKQKANEVIGKTTPEVAGAPRYLGGQGQVVRSCNEF